ncbi:hypothetical protein ACFQY5_31365 [Paeniroseomonas aquatica]|uniref:hypothetical protein n=1 Tax=Paeniroseomonas aquatica TaxID=373043 RepID=UPI003612859D
MTEPGLDEPGRLELLHLAEEALRRLAPTLPPDAAALLRRLQAAVPTAELASPEAMAAGAASLFALAQDRPAGVTRLRLLPPGPGQGAHAVAEVVTDDMPFLVDSLLGALARQGRVVRQLLHPVVAVRRDPAGRLLALGDAPGAVLESMMRVTLDAAPAAMLPGTAAAAPEDWPALQESLARALADTRIAVADFPAMAAVLRRAEAEVTPPAAEPGAVEFLRWLAEDISCCSAIAAWRWPRVAASPRCRRRISACCATPPCRSSTCCATSPPCRRGCATPWRRRRRSASPRRTCAARCTGRSTPTWW